LRENPESTKIPVDCGRRARAGTAGQAIGHNLARFFRFSCAEARAAFCYSLSLLESTKMAKSVNKVILLGNVGKDPEIRSTGGGTMVANLTLATSDRYQDQQGNWQDRTEWHNLVAFKRTAEIIRDYVKKGSKLYIEGKIQTRSWDDKESGAKRYRTEIIVNDLSLLSGREEGSGGYSRTSSQSGAPSSYDQRPPAGQDDLAQSAEISDDDIPF
jgi:single-strand DNA-binding protein